MHRPHLSDKGLELRFLVGFLQQCWPRPTQPASWQRLGAEDWEGGSGASRGVLSLLPPPLLPHVQKGPVPWAPAVATVSSMETPPPTTTTKLMGVEVRWLCVGCELRQGSLTCRPGPCPAAQALETAQRGESDSEAHLASPQVRRQASDPPRVPLAPVSQCSQRAGTGHRTSSPRLGPDKGQPHDLPLSALGVCVCVEGGVGGLVRQGQDSRHPGAGVGFKHKVLRETEWLHFLKNMALED